MTANTSDTKNAKKVRSRIWRCISRWSWGGSFPAQRHIVHVDDDEQIEQSGHDQEGVAVFVRPCSHVPCPEPERPGNEIRNADADVGDGGEADEPLRHVEREQAAVKADADREHGRQRDQKDETLRLPPEPQVTGAGSRPRREAQQHEPARLRLLGGGGAHGGLVYFTSPDGAPPRTPAFARSALRRAAVPWRRLARPPHRPPSPP